MPISAEFNAMLIRRAKEKEKGIRKRMRESLKANSTYYIKKGKTCLRKG
jgi:hypothetical protein